MSGDEPEQRGWEMYPERWVGGHSLTGSRSEPFQTQACGGLVETSPLTGEMSPAPGPQRAGLGLEAETRQLQKVNQTSLCYKQGGCESGGARLGELDRDPKGKFFPHVLEDMGCLCS